MLKEVLRSLDSGVLAVVGLLAFVLAFVLVVIRVMTMKKKEREEAKRIPLEDDEDVARKPENDYVND